MLELKVAAEAAADLDEILRFSTETFGAAAAERYFAMIERAVIRLREFPDSGASYPGIKPPVRYTEVGSHRIFYSRHGDLLTIRRVLHQAMQAQKRL